jgi:hypothetical protein
MLVDPEWILKARHGVPFKPFALEAFAQLY